MLKGTDDGEEFAIPDWVVMLGFSEGRGIITHRVL